MTCLQTVILIVSLASMSGSTTGVPRIVPWAVDPPLVVVLRAAGTVRRAGRGGHRTLEASLGFGCARLIVGFEPPSVDGPLWRGGGFSPWLPYLESISVTKSGQSKMASLT